ncbi:MAG: hypothetical protein H0T76_02000 [Nannocystis sp.]|nr:hypothetical protein [Nannocystis sp.]MBA3545235.1 hypothetical protein [Nannocystis sp.]
MSNTENSALIALSELKNLEANRVADIASQKQAKEDSERRAREDAERRAREEAERIAKTEAERLARLAAEQEARDREERLRLQEADLRARAEQEARLKEEQMRLDAQVKLAEKKAKPVWLFAMLGVLVLGLGGGGYYFYKYTEEQAEDTRQKEAAAAVAKAAQDKANAEQKAAMDALMAELKGLKEEQNRLEGERKSLAEKLDTVTDETERQRLINAQKDLEDKIADNKKKQTTKKPSDSGEAKPEKSKGGITVKKNVDDPLDGL